MKKLAIITIPLVLVLLVISSYLALVVAPTEATMGDVQRIFYYHVSSGWVGMLCLFINFVASIWYLWKRSPASDALAAASAEVGVVFVAVLLMRASVGAASVGHLVDVGREVDDHTGALADLCELPGAAELLRWDRLR